MPMSCKGRPQSARLDVLTMMLGGGGKNKRSVSPADSLSPCRGDYPIERDEIPRSAHEHSRSSDKIPVSPGISPSPTWPTSAGRSSKFHEDLPSTIKTPEPTNTSLSWPTSAGESSKFLEVSTKETTEPASTSPNWPKSACGSSRFLEVLPSTKETPEPTSTSPSSTGPDLDDWFVSEPSRPDTGKSLSGFTFEAGTPSAQTTTTATRQQRPASHVPATRHSKATAANNNTSLTDPRCLLSRPNRPVTISIDGTNGASTLPAYKLKQAIKETSLAAAPPQILTVNLAPPPIPPRSPERGRPRHRRSPALQISDLDVTMGNHPSHLDPAHDNASDQADDRSASVQRNSRSKATRVPRRSSINVFKRFDASSPHPTEITATVIEVPRAATAPNLDGMVDDDDDETEEDEPERIRARHAHRHSAPSPSIPMHPVSPSATLTEESAARPISASGTITGRQPDIQTQDSAEQDSPTHLRVSALSPTLPAPSPIPEDSPHKYGLKDRMDTPEAASPPPPDIEIAKARRRSSGLAIFNEAKNLQSASSFLNGLSTARRRAESRAQSRNATDNSQNTNGTVVSSTSVYNCISPSYTQLPASATVSTINPYSSISQNALPHLPNDADLDLNIDLTNRNLGHYFKSSGYAYSPPMSLTQIKCYRSHNRLLPSRNTCAPVECAVCHADDERQHWSCGWCALRMCAGCRKALETTGVSGLRERVRASEMGGY